MHKKQSSSEQVTIEIKSKLQTFNRNIQKNISSNLGNPLKWYIENVTKDKTPNVPRISILQEALKTLRQTIPDKRILNEIFLQEKSVNEIIFESQHFVDMAFVLRQHLALKMNKKVQYASIIMDTIHNKLSYFFQKEKQKLASLLRVNHVFSFIEFKKVGMQQIYDKISEFELKQLREEVSLMYTFLIKPWLQKRTPSKYYEELSDIIYWNVIIQDDTQDKELMIIGLNEKISNYFCSRKRSDNAFNYVKLFGYLLDILSVNYRKQDPFKIYGLAPLMNLWQQEIQIDQITIWLQNKGKQLKPQQVQNIFRNTYHVGSTIFMFNLIEKFSKALKAKNQFNILYHLYLSYIKKEYLDISLPNQTFINTYFQILEFYVIGFINQDRLDGESELDKLTKNISSFLLDKKFTYRKHHDTVIMFYKVYEARFSYLSSISRKFVSDLQRLYKYYPQLSDIHNKIHRGVFRQANMNEDENSGFQQLNIKRTDRYRGMMNLGNTCYMNSFMQAMFMTKKFRSTVLDIRDQQSLPSSKTLFYALSNLFTEMSTKTIGNDSEIIPQLFKMQTPEPFKSSWDQHDVAQFGRMYFQSLMNELQDNSTKERMQKIFFNKIRKSLICYNCKNQKSNLEQVFDFILHLNKKDDSISVSRLLGEYFQGQQMVGENQVYCDRCRKNTNASAIPHPVKFAQFLIISIGLFEYSGGGKKIKKPFNFQFNINFSKILPNENVPDDNYELYAFIVHIGNQSERGHYICYARNLQENPTIWYCFDDGYVTERQIENVQKFQFGESQTPYLLFYSASKKRKSIQNINFDKLGSQLFSK